MTNQNSQIDLCQLAKHNERLLMSSHELSKQVSNLAQQDSQTLMQAKRICTDRLWNCLHEHPLQNMMQCGNIAHVKSSTDRLQGKQFYHLIPLT